jgi:EPS-associated MarR family transcriptional regulator
MHGSRSQPLPDRLNCVHHVNRLAMAASEATDVETARALEAMRLLEARPDLSQRELSRALGLSLGKTHYVLHALLDKGLVKIQNFRRNDNKLAYAYLLTPKGVKAKLQLTRRFLARKEAEFERLQTTIAQLRHEVRAANSADAPGRPEA